MASGLLNVLFLGAGNTARSVLAEAILRKDGAGRFNPFSAGSPPKGVVNPLALSTRAAHGYPAEGFRSKSWDEFAAPESPAMNFVFTVSDDAAGEACPFWPGHPATAHWGVADPAAVVGPDTEKARAFETAFRLLRDRIAAFLALPRAALDPAALIARLREIGRMGGDAARARGVSGAEPLARRSLARASGRPSCRRAWSARA